MTPVIASVLVISIDGSAALSGHPSFRLFTRDNEAECFGAYRRGVSVLKIG